MPISVETGPASREDERGRWTAVKEERHDIPQELGYVPDNAHLAVQSVSLLPTPSATPSPRSTSPSLVVTDSTEEWAGNLSSIIHQQQGFEKMSNELSEMGNNEDAIASPLPISKTLPVLQLHDIPEEHVRRPRRSSAAKSPRVDVAEISEETPRKSRRSSAVQSPTSPSSEVLKLSASEITELTSAPESIPTMLSPTRRTSISGHSPLLPPPAISRRGSASDAQRLNSPEHQKDDPRRSTISTESLRINPHVDRRLTPEISSAPPNTIGKRPGYASRALSTPPLPSTRMSSYQKPPTNPSSPKRKPIHPSNRPDNLDLDAIKTPPTTRKSPSDIPPPSPIPDSLPIPPMSIPTYLQLELSSSRPSPLYLYRSAASEIPYESAKIKFERLLNFLILPPKLEQVLGFGSLACLDAVLYTFTILPLRFFIALAILVQWWAQVCSKEARFVLGFIWHGTGRMWDRQRDRNATDSPARSRSVSRVRRPGVSTNPSFQTPISARTPLNTNGNPSLDQFKAALERKSRPGWSRKHHRRSKSEPSTLSSNHKADLLQGAVIVCSCLILLKFDASKMYHSIKGRSNIKLYVIFNLLDVCDKLLSALGQDIFECLFSDETLERDSLGRSRVLRPLGMFILALIYNTIHAAALFYQVITLNVAVNSYSNALLTLLLSMQFVEIKGSVFKKFELDNLFQMTCADVVERFTLWFMLVIIALRNIVEVGGLSFLLGTGPGDFMNDVPLRGSSVIPASFTMFPLWAGEVVSPFIMVLGSEMLVDWIKHCYLSKFNAVKPAVYVRFLDILTKDYYTNAFVNQNLVKRLGLPVIPLACLFIRSSVQTYNMFLATQIPAPIPSSTVLALESPLSTPISSAALEHFDSILRLAHPYLPSSDDLIAWLTMLVFFLCAFFVLLAFKLLLGMVLLRFARNQYRSMKEREREKDSTGGGFGTGGKRVGGWGMIEVDEKKRAHIYVDDEKTLAKKLEKEKGGKDMTGKNFERISRYEMAAKRIW